MCACACASPCTCKREENKRRGACGRPDPGCSTSCSRSGFWRACDPSVCTLAGVCWLHEPACAHSGVGGEAKAKAAMGSRPSSRRPSASAQRPAAQPRGAGRPTLACTRASATSPCPAPRRATGFFRCGLPGRPPAAASPSPGVGRRRMGWAGRCGWRAGWRREASSSLPEASPAPPGAEPHLSGLPLWWGQCHQGFPRGMRFGGAF